MDKAPLFFNKIVAAILTASLIALGIGFLVSAIYQPDQLAEPAFSIQTNDDPSLQTAANSNAAGDELDDLIAPMLASANIEKGKKVSKKCTACHTFAPDGANRVGPKLYDIIGRTKASIDEFGYSSALKGADGNWDYEAMDAFLKNPKKAYPGTKMNFVGLKKINDRANLIAWLRTLSDNPVALP